MAGGEGVAPRGHARERDEQPGRGVTAAPPPREERQGGAARAPPAETVDDVEFGIALARIEIAKQEGHRWQIRSPPPRPSSRRSRAASPLQKPQPSSYRTVSSAILAP